MTIPPTKSVVEILQEANLKLSLLSFSYEEMHCELLMSKIQFEKLTADLKRKNNALEDLVKIDHLAGVANHRYFQHVFDHELNRAAVNRGKASLLLMDIDLFKQVNDTYGHQAGDFILSEFCRIIGAILRDYDFLARYSGEEFVVILPDTDSDSAVTVAEKIRCYTEKHVFSRAEGDISTTVSIGVACTGSGNRNVAKNTLISWADSALYAAKNNGRNKVVCHF